MAKILVVDDEKSIRMVLTAFLSRDGHEVVQMPSATEALKHVDDSIDLVITDIVMPALDGVSFLGQLRETYKELPVVMLTGEPNTRTANRAREYGAYAYLAKPFSGVELVQLVRDALKGRD